MAKVTQFIYSITSSIPKLAIVVLIVAALWYYFTDSEEDGKINRTVINSTFTTLLTVGCVYLVQSAPSYDHLISIHPPNF